MANIPFRYLCLACIFIPEDDPVTKSEVFPVYWNVPTFQCHQHGFNFTAVSEKWNIRQNEGDQFRGSEIAILYDPGEFPAFLLAGGYQRYVPRNGGVPQNGDLNRHLYFLRNHVNKLIPDPNFSGLGIIDFEEWRPIFRQNWLSMNVYRTYSLMQEQQHRIGWPSYKITNMAVKNFEESSKIFLQKSIELVKSMRPYARWGYYGFPLCFNYSPKNYRSECSDEVQEENKRIIWLFQESTALFPSIYLNKKLNESHRVGFITGRLEETRRLRSNQPFFPYVRFKYPDTKEFLSYEDLLNSVLVSQQMGASGIIIWGASNDVNTKQKCEALQNYLHQVLGPVVSLIQSGGNRNVLQYPG